MSEISPFVDTQFVFENLNNSNFCIVDASWHMPNSDQSALDNFTSGHIPGAIYFDLDKIADTSSTLPHMVASPETFERMVGELGIGENDTIIIYDSSGLFSAARVWWNFKIMGAKNCFVLRGGLPKWRRENRPITTGKPSPKAKQFNAVMQTEQVAEKSELLKIATALENLSEAQIIDVRAKARFSAQAPEPRPGMRSGRIPGSKNLPFMDLIKDGEMIDPGAIN
ncbi:3-mercaptopyruvate sulfurtransferase, partial [hydrothermal vent metagenome]